MGSMIHHMLDLNGVVRLHGVHTMKLYPTRLLLTTVGKKSNQRDGGVLYSQLDKGSVVERHGCV